MDYDWNGAIMEFVFILITLAIALLVFERNPETKDRRMVFGIYLFSFFIFRFLFMIFVEGGWIMTLPSSLIAFAIVSGIGSNKPK